MENDKELRRQVAERLRLAAKELRWAAANIEQIYDMIKPSDMPEIEPKNQLKLFQDEQD